MKRPWADAAPRPFRLIHRSRGCLYSSAILLLLQAIQGAALRVVVQGRSHIRCQNEGL